ncbi:MAG: GDP-L-fucose synthase [Bacteroidetes bacterium]|nr:GDP-L-fucose synthase [Bacteroidota bacterium]
MKQNSKIYVAGHRGMVGSAIVRSLQKDGYTNIITATSKELDLRNQYDVLNFFDTQQPEYIFLAAAKVGGIQANNIYRADFIYDNLAIECNVINAAYRYGAKKLLFLGSSCIYPKLAPQPIKEEHLLTGALEQTNEPYAIAKIAGLKMCEAYKLQYGCNFISAMPTNLYGPNDNYDLNNSHVLPALIRKFFEAKQNTNPTVTVWGTGSPMREFLHVDDLADASIFLMLHYNEVQHVNVGTGTDVTIKELVTRIQQVSGYSGEVIWDITKPDGTPRKLMDSTKIHSLGWKHKIDLQQGIEMVWEEYSRQQLVS